MCFALFLVADFLMRTGLARLVVMPRSAGWLALHLLGGFLGMAFYLLPAALVWPAPGVVPKLGALLAVFGAMLSVLLVRSVFLPQAVANSMPLIGMAGFILSQEFTTADTIETAYLALGLLVLAWYFVLALFKFNQHQRELAQARDAALARAETQKHFLATMSHELRTPLNGILGMAEHIVAQRPGVGGELIRDSARDMAAIVGDLLDKAAIDAGALRIDIRACTLAQELQRLMQQWQDRFAAKGVDLTLVLDPALPRQVMTDSLRLSQCLSNLLSNALRHTERGSVTLALAPRPGGIIALVTDTGIGVAEGAEDDLFQPFAISGGGSRGPEGGTGLGLSISRGLARATGGDLTFERPAAGGACFRLVLPAPAVTRDSPGEQTPAVDRSTASGLGAGLRILVVDDIATNRLVLRLLLERNGVSVTEAASGAEALQRIKARADAPPDAVLMDLRMPGLSGEDALQCLRETGLACPVLAVSADAAAESLSAALARGFDGYITKPVEERHLLAALSAALAQRAGAPVSPL